MDDKTSACERKGEFPYDVFLAHNSEDKPTVGALASELKKHGLRPWLDSEQIRPGHSIQDAIQHAIQNSRSIAICLGPGGLGTWQAIELKTAVSQCMKRGIPLIPVLLPHAESVPDNLPFLAEFNWVKFGVSVTEQENVARFVWGISGEKPTLTDDSQPSHEASPRKSDSIDSGRPGCSGKVLFALHGIRTYAGWIRALYEIATDYAWQVRTDRWNFGYLSALQFLMPWARSAKVKWFRQAYREETNDKGVLLDQGQYPSIVAHSFGTFILGNALLRYDWIRFNKVVLCGSILPVDFPWDKLIERGQVQAVRNEYGVHDVWSGIVPWFVANTGASGRIGFQCTHKQLEQERFEYTHSEYFDKGHMEAKWIPFIRRNITPGRTHEVVITRPRGSRPWAMFSIYLLLLVIAIILGSKPSLLFDAMFQSRAPQFDLNNPIHPEDFPSPVSFFAGFPEKAEAQNYQAPFKANQVTLEYINVTSDDLQLIFMDCTRYYDSGQAPWHTFPFLANRGPNYFDGFLGGKGWCFFAVRDTNGTFHDLGSVHVFNSIRTRLIVRKQQGRYILSLE